MSVVGPFGCLVKAKLGGDPKTYWGVRGPSNITLPCAPSGADSYLSPQGLAKKLAVDLIRKAEKKERLAYAASFQAAQAAEGAKKRAEV